MKERIGISKTQLIDICHDYVTNRYEKFPSSDEKFADYTFEIYEPERLNETARKGCDSPNSENK